MFTKFTTDTIDLHVAASQVVGAFNTLTKVNSLTFVPLYQEYVDTKTVIENLWPILDVYLKKNNDTRNCEAIVEHYNVSNSIVTGISVDRKSVV